MSILAARWVEYEKPYADNSYYGAENGSMVTVLPGNLPILITAVHATRHFAGRGEFKVHDRWTGGLATLLAEKLNAPAILRRRMGYFDDDEKVWEAIEQHIQTHRPRFILDLHACVSACPWDMVFGTSTTKALTEIQRSHLITIREIAKAQGFSHLLKWIGPVSPEQTILLKVLREQSEAHGLTHQTNTISYAALSSFSVTTQAMAMGIPTVQIELRPEVRDPVTHTDSALRTFKALVAAIGRLL